MADVTKEGLSEKKAIPTDLPADLKRSGANQTPKKSSESASKGGKNFKIT